MININTVIRIIKCYFAVNIIPFRLNRSVSITPAILVVKQCKKIILNENIVITPVSIIRFCIDTKSIEFLAYCFITNRCCISIELIYDYKGVKFYIIYIRRN